MDIKCITFDLDDTLWDCHPVILRAEKLLYQWMEQYFPKVSHNFAFQELIAHREGYCKQFPSMQHNCTWLRKKWLMHLAVKYEYPKKFVEDGFSIFWKARNKVSLFKGVHEILHYAKERYQVLSITNGNADIHEVGIGDYFHHSISASEEGSAKPAPPIFRRALMLASVSADKAIHVGNDPIRDIQGAAAIGMKTVWVNMSRAKWTGPLEPDAEINHISQLKQVLEK